MSTKEKKVLEDIFSRLLGAREEEIEAAFGDIIAEIAKRNDLEDPDSLYLAFVYPFGDILDAALKKRGSVLQKYQTLIINHWTFKNIIEKIIVDFEGSACCADKSSWLINGFIEYKKSSKLPDMVIGEEEFWKPRFGRAAEWMEFIESIDKLLHGNWRNFVVALQCIIKAGKDKYSEAK